MMNRILGTIAVASIATPAAFAGVYVNVEANSSLTGTDYSSTTTDVHVGYEDTAGVVDWYVQGGPAVVAADAADESDNQLSGKVGASIAATEKLGFYGEISVITADGDVDNSWGTKIGTKYSF